MLEKETVDKTVVYLAGLVLVFSVITGIVLLLCCFLHIKDLCVKNSNQIKEEALQFQLSNDSSTVTHMTNNWESRPSIQI